MDQELKDYLDRQRDYLDRQFAETREETSRQFVEAREETNRQLAEVREEMNRRFEETDRQFAETNRRLDETNRRFEETDQQLAELRQEVHESGILFEDLEGKFQMVVEGLDNNTQETHRLVDEVRRELREARAPIEYALKDLGPRVTKHDQQLQEHDQRLSALESAAA